MFPFLQIILPGLSQFFSSTIVPIAGDLLKFTLPRLLKIPLYLQLLWTLYQDPKTDAEARKYLTSALLIIGGILTFMAYSYIPLTGTVVGILTTPVAGMLALVVSLASLDIVFHLNEGYLSKQYPTEFARNDSEIDELSKIMGESSESWDKVVKQTQKLLDLVKEKIDPDRNYDDTISSLIYALISYLKTPQDAESLSPDEVNRRIVVEGLPNFTKTVGSVGEGIVASTITGLTANTITAGMFVQASFWTSIQTALGFSTGGIVVSGSAYALLTIAAPIGLAAVAGVGVGYGANWLRNEGEKRKLSAFLADILIASLPIAWVDGDFSREERDALEKLMHSSALNKEDTKRIRETMDKHKTFEDVLNAGLLKEENPQKARMKHRLILCTAYELAKADGAIGKDEIEMHDRMAKFMNLEEEVAEIRRLILLKSGVDMRDRISVVCGDITQQSVDAIVNSASPTLLPGNRVGWLTIPGDSKKVESAIHRAAGASLQKECQSLQGCAVGEAKITEAYELPAKWVIHTVPPTWTIGNILELESLAQCYRSSLTLAHEHSICTVAFPALGTGSKKFPVDRAAQIAIAEIHKFLNTHLGVERVEIVCIDEKIYQKYVDVLAKEFDAAPVSSESGKLVASVV